MAIVYSAKDTIKGWFIGNYDKTVLNTWKFEVAVKHYKKDDYEQKHFHLKAIEATIIISGSVLINGEQFNADDIILIDPGEAIDFKCLTDVITSVVKVPSEKNDKFLTTVDTKYKICTSCGLKKVHEAFNFKDKKTGRRDSICNKCYKKVQHEHYLLHRDEIIEKNREYALEHKEQTAAARNTEEAKTRRKQSRNGALATKLYSKKYYEENKEEIIKKSIIAKKEKLKTDPIAKIKHAIGCAIRKVLDKKGESFLPHLEYTADQFKEYIESLFEPWMKWENWGVYNRDTWNDNDNSTWTWNLDHIKPQSHFKYESMDDPEFKKCWALSNLRPYSAKQNILDGNRKNNKSLGIEPIK